MPHQKFFLISLIVNDYSSLSLNWYRNLSTDLTQLQFVQYEVSNLIRFIQYLRRMLYRLLIIIIDL